MAEEQNVEGQVEETEANVDGNAETEWKPPTQAEWKAAQEKLKKANSEAAAHRKQADALRKTGESESDTKVREAVEAATKTERDRANRIAVNKGLKAALAEAGYTGNLDVAKRLVELDGLEVDDDGEVTGLDDQIKALKKEVPEKFRRNGAANVDGGDRTNNGNSKYTADELDTLRMLKDAGYPVAARV